MTASPALPDDYINWLSSLSSEIQGARARSVLSVNREVVHLYHRIGTEIIERQARQGWGTGVIERLSGDLCAAFPDMKGLSSRNLKYMKAFALACPQVQFARARGWFRLPGPPALPEPLDTKLPTIEQLEQELSTGLGEGEDGDDA